MREAPPLAPPPLPPPPGFTPFPPAQATGGGPAWASGWQGPLNAWASRAGVTAPTEVTAVAVGMFVLAALLFYLPARYGFVATGHLFSGSSYVRAFAALVLYVLSFLTTAGVALVALGRGLVRGSRVAQTLTCLLCGILFLGELIRATQSSQSLVYGSAQPTAITVLIELICVSVVIALVLPSRARAFFSADPQLPVGVAVGWATATYFGWCVGCGGVALLIAGITFGAKFVVWGLLSILAGAMLIWARRWFGARVEHARVLVTVAFAGYVVLGFAMGATEDAGASFNTLVPFFVALMGVWGLWLAPGSASYFGAQLVAGPRPPVDGNYIRDYASAGAPPQPAGRGQGWAERSWPGQGGGPMSGRTNPLAIVALVLSCTTSIGGIVLGHIALHQIRRSGERGRGLAIAALVVGYGWLVLVVVLYASLAAAVSQA